MSRNAWRAYLLGLLGVFQNVVADNSAKDTPHNTINRPMSVDTQDKSAGIKQSVCKDAAHKAYAHKVKDIAQHGVTLSVWRAYLLMSHPYVSPVCLDLGGDCFRHGMADRRVIGFRIVPLGKVDCPRGNGIAVVVLTLCHDKHPLVER